MRTLVDLPLVTCQLGLLDGIADIASFRAGAASANWTNHEITIVVINAVYKSSYFDDVGEFLSQYCTSESAIRDNLKI